MISRRNIRIKVMQSLYAHAQDPGKTVDRLEKTMLENINAATRNYFFNLYILCKTAEYVVSDVQIQSGKYLQPEAAGLMSVALFHNPIIQHLVVQEELYREIEREKLNLKVESDAFRQFYQKLKKTPAYAAYSQMENPLLPDDKEILTRLYKEVLLNDERFEQIIEDAFATWADDRELIFFAVTGYLSNFSPAQPPGVIRSAKDLKVVKQFGIELLRKSIAVNEETEALIVPALQNWDRERVALLDLLLMKMALTELLYFPDIPVKVTMNEYIDLSKSYSTPKSGEFVNGILDAIMKKLKEENRIVKTGRGTQES